MSVAGVAHPVERHLAKVEVASSSLVTRSIKDRFLLETVFFFSLYGRVLTLPQPDSTEMSKFSNYPGICHLKRNEVESRDLRTHEAYRLQSVRRSLDSLPSLGMTCLEGSHFLQTLKYLYVQGGSRPSPTPILKRPKYFSVFLKKGIDIFVNRAIIRHVRCGCSSSGRAPPCQGGGSEFEPRHPLHKTVSLWKRSFSFFLLIYKNRACFSAGPFFFTYSSMITGRIMGLRLVVL